MRIRLEPRYHRWIYLFLLLCMAAGLPLSKALISSSLIGLGIHWLWEGDFAAKWERLKKGRAIWALMAFYLLHVIGMLYTAHGPGPAHDPVNDPIGEGFRDLRVKLPLLLLPFIIGTSQPLERKEFFGVLLVFIAAVIADSFKTAMHAAGWIGAQVTDLRKASDDVALIRLSLMAVLSVFIMAYFFLKKEVKAILKIVAVVAALWLIYFMIYMQSLTGIVVLFCVTFLLLCVYAVLHRKRIFIVSLLVLFLGITGGATWYVKHVYDTYYRGGETVDWAKLPQRTAQGNYFEFYPNEYMIENGHYVMKNICWKELGEEWPKRSHVPLFKEGLGGNQMAYVLVRYLTSKDQLKDAAAVRALTDEEVRAIEGGVTNYRFAEMPGIARRIYQTIWEIDVYLHSGNPSDKSIPMRIEFWKASRALIARHPVFGAGTGDMPATFYNYYNETHSQLSEQWRTLHAHNQFLSFTVQFGFFGLLLFVFSLIYPGREQKRFRNYFYLVFFFIVMVSFLNEDTIETQQGVTFYAFFNTLLLFAQPGNGLMGRKKS